MALHRASLEPSLQPACSASRGMARGFASWTLGSSKIPVCGSNFALEGSSWQPREQYRRGAGGVTPIHAYSGNGGRRFTLVDVKCTSGSTHRASRTPGSRASNDRRGFVGRALWLDRASPVRVTEVAPSSGLRS